MTRDTGFWTFLHFPQCRLAASTLSEIPVSFAVKVMIKLVVINTLKSYDWPDQ